MYKNETQAEPQREENIFWKLLFSMDSNMQQQAKEE